MVANTWLQLLLENSKSKKGHNYVKNKKMRITVPPLLVRVPLLIVNNLSEYDNVNFAVLEMAWWPKLMHFFLGH